MAHQFEVEAFAWLWQPPPQHAAPAEELVLSVLDALLEPDDEPPDEPPELDL